jgi:hypothetical protein
MKLLRGGIFVALSLLFLIGMTGTGCTEREKVEQTGMAVADSEGPIPTQKTYRTVQGNGQVSTFKLSNNSSVDLNRYLVTFIADVGVVVGDTLLNPSISVSVIRIDTVPTNRVKWTAPPPPAINGYADQPVSVIVVPTDTEKR